MSYHNLHIRVQISNPLYEWCSNITQAANNLYNAALYIERQLRSGLRKEPSERFENEKEVIERIENALPQMNQPRQKTYNRKMEQYQKSSASDKTEPKLKLFSMPTVEKPLIWYDFLDALLKATKNSDYCCKALPKQTAQQVLKNVCRNMKAYFTAMKSYRQDQSKFTGEPKFPKYHKKGGYTTAVVSNQQCRIVQDENGLYWAAFAKTDKKCCLGKSVKGKLKEVHISPFHGIFELNFIFETEDEESASPTVSSRICAIDFGVNNIAAITNNTGLPFLLFKGGVVKSANQWYNKKMAKIKSEQTKGTENKFVPTPESDKLCLRREAQISDFMHKTAKRIIEWCVANNIDTIVMGINKGWKQEANMGKVNNQNFVQIPFVKLQSIIRYLAEWNHILVVEQEESYTSKASFLDLDPIPVYEKDSSAEYKFSGYRETRGNYKRKGSKKRINADLNGSANIGRKAFPDLFTPETCSGFNSVTVFKHPDQTMILANKEKQKQMHPPKKQTLLRKSNPSGIECCECT